MKVMRLFAVILFNLAANTFCFSQDQIVVIGDTLKSIDYDTVQVEIRSEKAFPFCSNIYKLPRDCKDNYPPNCCSYTTTIQKTEKVATSGFVSCGNGSSLSWYYNNSLEGARQNFQNIPSQWEQHQKTFSKKAIKCFVLGKESEAYQIDQETFEGYKFYSIVTYGANNGYYFYLEYRSRMKIMCNEDIQPLFRQLLRIN